jgi:hypothetical protein
MMRTATSSVRPFPYALIFLFVLAFGGTPQIASASSISLLNNGDFEGAVLPSAARSSWTASVYGQWAVGDPMAVVGTASGITPLGGSKMMDFSNTGGVSADVYQIVDLTAFASEIDAGLVTVDTAAYFNAVSTTAVGMALLRWTAAPTAFSGYTLLHSGFGFATDSSVATWQQFGYSGTILTAGTRYLAFGLNVPTSAPQAYVDNASLTLNIRDGVSTVPEPTTIALLGSGLLGGVLERRRRKGSRR